MLALILIILLAGLTVCSISLQRTYERVPAYELRRRARAGDQLAASLYQAANYGASLRAVLWTLSGLAAAGFFVLLSRHTATWLAVSGSALLVWTAFVWLPAGQISQRGQNLAARVALPLAWVLAYIHPGLEWLWRLARRYRTLHFHTGLYEVEDLLELLDGQQVQADNRIEQTELDIARHALTFGNRHVIEVMVPRRVVKMVKADEDVGPVLLSELHKSGHSRFPVYGDSQDQIVGTLHLRDLLGKSKTGKVSTHMQPQTYYAHEDQPLSDVLQAILKTHQHLFVVVNTFEEYVGIICLEDVLEQIVGRPIIDEFDLYDDLRAVAARAAHHDHQQHLTQPVKANQNTAENITE
jgi:CBS domain containing-hemolysin-like protein